MCLPGRKYSAGNSYRYGFNGKENDNEVKGEGNQQDYGMRIYDPRLGRFLSEDPITKTYPELTPYQFASNRPIEGIDQDGLEFLSSFKSTQQQNFAAKTYLQTAPPKIKEPEILMPDIYGNGHIGPQSVVRENVAIIKQNYYNAVANNIAGGVFGAADYLLNPKGGGFKGAALDGITMSFGGIPAGKSSAFPEPSNSVNSRVLTPTEIAPLETTPINISVKLKSSWNKEQEAAAYNKVQTLNNDPDTKVTIKNNPVIRPSNLRSTFQRNGGVVKKGQDVDHIRDLQLNGTNAQSNLNGLDQSVNRSVGPQIYEQIKNVPDGTRVNHVSINPFQRN